MVFSGEQGGLPLFFVVRVRAQWRGSSFPIFFPRLPSQRSNADTHTKCCAPLLAWFIPSSPFPDAHQLRRVHRGRRGGSGQQHSALQRNGHVPVGRVRQAGWGPLLWLGPRARELLPMTLPCPAELARPNAAASGARQEAHVIARHWLVVVLARQMHAHVQRAQHLRVRQYQLGCARRKHARNGATTLGAQEVALLLGDALHAHHAAPVHQRKHGAPRQDALVAGARTVQAKVAQLGRARRRSCASDGGGALLFLVSTKRCGPGVGCSFFWVVLSDGQWRGRRWCHSA